MMPDNPALLRGGATEVTGSLSAVSHNLASSKNSNSFFSYYTFDLSRKCWMVQCPPFVPGELSQQQIIEDSNTTWTNAVLSLVNAAQLTVIISLFRITAVCSTLVLVPACSYIQYLMEPSPEPCRNCLTGIISE